MNVYNSFGFRTSVFTIKTHLNNNLHQISTKITPTFNAVLLDKLGIGYKTSCPFAIK